MLEMKKDRKYERLLNNYCFVPIALETFGAWGQTGLKFIKEIGRKITEKTNDKNATQHIIQAISMAVQRGNATSIVGTLGPQRKLEYFDIIQSNLVLVNFFLSGKMFTNARLFTIY